MNNTTACQDSAVVLRALVEAVRRGEVDEAERLLEGIDDGSLIENAEAVAAAVKLHLHRRRWERVQQLYSRVADLDAAGALTLRLARNMSALRRTRPEVYEVLSSVDATERYQFASASPGAPATIAAIRPGDKPLLLSVGPHPVEGVRQLLSQIHAPGQEGAAVGVVGIGDGYLLSALAQQPPKLFMDQQQTVHLVEPDAELVRMCLMLHDYTGEHGPIGQARFQWHIGAGWFEHFRDAILNDLCLPPPVRQVRQGNIDEEVVDRMQSVFVEMAKRDAACKREVDSYYASITNERWVELFSHAPPRRPRVLLLTTRFSTVLQYATRDTAEGFRRIGWETRVLIEPTTYHRQFPHAMRKAFAEFRPDLIFQIDHLRHEHGDVFPAQIPFAGWVQDLLPNLTNRQAGAKVSQRDFVLAFNIPSFIDDFGYPASQCIDMSMMLTLPPEGKVVETEGLDGDDLVYVSNVSQQPRAAAAQLLGSRVPPGCRALMEACFDEMIEHYDAGGSYPSHQDIYRLFDRVHERFGRQAVDERTHTLLTQILWNPMNIALYRQQALRWVAELAREMGLSLAIYGRGWESHPDFAAYARGVVEHGPALETLTRRTKINLNLEPYPCFTHHRLLDGLVAGGFFLVRRHPANTLLQALFNFMIEHLPGHVQTTRQARAMVRVEHRAELEALLAQAGCISLSKTDDAVRQVLCWQRAGVLVRQDQAMPRLEEVSFDDKTSLRRLIERFLGDRDLRRAVSVEQRRSVENRLTFPVAIKRVVREIHERLRRDA